MSDIGHSTDLSCLSSFSHIICIGHFLGKQNSSGWTDGHRKEEIEGGREERKLRLGFRSFVRWGDRKVSVGRESRRVAHPFSHTDSDCMQHRRRRRVSLRWNERRIIVVRLTDWGGELILSTSQCLSRPLHVDRDIAASLLWREEEQLRRLELLLATSDKQGILLMGS